MSGKTLYFAPGIFIFIFSIMLFQSADLCAGRRFLVGTYQNEPYVMTSPGGKVSGICIEVMEEIARLEGWELEYVGGTWQQCVDNLQNGKIDILVAMAWSEAREENFDFSKETLLKTWGQAFVPESSGIRSILDLDGRKIAVLGGDIYAGMTRTAAERFGVEPEFVECGDYHSVLKMVAAGEADAGIVDRVLGYMYGDDYDLKGTPFLISPIEVRFAFRKGKWAGEIRTIDRHVRMMTADRGSVLHASTGRFLERGRRKMPSWLIGMHMFLFVVVPVLVVAGILMARRIRKTRTTLSERDDELNHAIAVTREAEQLLDITEGKYRLLFQNSPESIAIFDMDGRIIEVNRLAAKMAGLENREMRGRHIGEIGLLKPSIGLILEKFGKLRDEGRCDPFEIDMHPAGAEDPRRFIVTASMARGDEGEPVIYTISTDITDRVDMEEQIRQMQKLDAIGTLAGGVAHDFNNLLTGILGYANMLKLSHEDDAEIYRFADMIEKSAQRGSKLTSQLLAFARKGKIHVKPVDINACIRGVVSLLERTTIQNIAISVDLGAKFPAVPGDPGQIEQVIMNLALNAMESMPSGGSLIIGTRNVELDKARCGTRKDARPGKYVLVSVEDTGHGIPKELQHRVFEPFFTTRKAGGGPGLGLAVVYGIVKNHGGCVTLESDENEGTRVHVYLPADKTAGIPDGNLAPVMPVPENPSRGKSAPKKQGSAERAGGRIVIVDDEETVLKMSGDMLTKLGYRIEIFNDPAKAITYYEEHGAQVDLVILDMIMPGIDGAELFRRLRIIDPKLRAILSSGYIIDEKAEELLDEGLSGFIQKPFTISQLAELVEGLIGKPGF